MHNLSQFELRKLGVTIENFTAAIVSNRARRWQSKSCGDKLFDCPAECFKSNASEPMSVQIQPMNQNPSNTPATP